jgi:heme oxygenase
MHLTFRDRGEFLILKQFKLATGISHTALENQLPSMKHESECAFFASYGAQIGAHWRAFYTMLSENAYPAADQAGDEGRHAAVVAGANRSFEVLTRWLFPSSRPMVCPA